MSAFGHTGCILTVVNRHKNKSYDVYAGRPSVLGNPFQIGRDGTRNEVVAMYEDWGWKRMQVDAEFREAILNCEGKRVACWCAPANCHVNAIARLIERWKRESVKCAG